MRRETEDRGFEYTSSDPARDYRYKFCWRTETGAEGRLSRQDDVCLVLLSNPATKKGDKSSKRGTRYRCKEFVRSLGFGTMWTCNLFAYRDRSPGVLRQLRDRAIGPENDNYIREAIRGSDLIVCAWGVSAREPVGNEVFEKRVRDVVKMVNDGKTHDELFALGDEFTGCDDKRRGQPKDPLYLRKPLKDFMFRIEIRDGRLVAASDA